METLKRLIFETPLAIYIILVVAEAAVAAIWHGRRTRKLALALLVAPVLGLAVGLTSYLVETDLEQINSAMSDIARSVESGDLDAAVEHLDEPCLAPLSGGGKISKDEIILAGRTALRRRPVERLQTVGPVTTITGDKAITEVKVRIVLESNECVDTAWRLEWARREAGWRIVRVEIVSPPELADWSF